MSLQWKSCGLVLVAHLVLASSASAAEPNAQLRAPLSYDSKLTTRITADDFIKSSGQPRGPTETVVGSGSLRLEVMREYNDLASQLHDFNTSADSPSFQPLVKGSRGNARGRAPYLGLTVSSPLKETRDNPLLPK